ncbi:MAG: hypothetical protein AUG51_22560 [Acidobacteria bacterium 13_1_20CM_3_53_8]|nr:MAG: hypothetical protein AUG51_22560 [Acidobacteria bacterium 13_1_20CM_3_53_8]
MLRSLFLLLLLVVFAHAAFAQNTQNTQSTQGTQSHFEYFVGYTYERADTNADQFNTPAINTGAGVIAPTTFTQSHAGFNGWIAEFVGNINHTVGIVGSASGVYRTTTITDTNGNAFRAHLHLYQFLWGPRFNMHTSSRAVPFAHALFGYAHIGGSVDNFAGNSRTSNNAFAMAFGGGVDVEANHRVDVRAFEFDYAPTFFNSRRQDNYRFSFGIKIK